MTPRPRWLPAVVVALAGCRSPAPAPLSEGVYVWQRVWTEAVGGAMVDAAPVFDERIVLAVETDAGRQVWTGVWTADGQPVVDPGLDWTPAPRALGGPVGLALRWSSPETALAPGVVVGLVRSALKRANVSGWTVSSVHLDADIPAGLLTEWAAVVATVADETEEPVHVLALVDHIGKPGWTALTRAADRVVVQVHSVPLDRPTGPVLFDGDLARSALEEAAATTEGALAVALPTHTLTHRSTGAAVRASPADLAPWRAALAAGPPKHLEEVLWFRLPVPGDPSTWTGEALAEVRAGRVPSGTLRTSIGPAPPDWKAADTVRAVWLETEGPDHAPVPSLEVCSGGGPLAVTAMDDRYRVAAPSKGCVRLAVTAARWMAPEQRQAVALVLSGTPDALQVANAGE